MAQGHTVDVVGMGVSTSCGAGLAAFSAALRQGRVEPPVAGVRPAPSLDLRAALAAIGVPEPVAARAWSAARRAPFSTQLSVTTALEAWKDAGFFDEPPASESVSVIVAGHNLNLDESRALGERYADRPDFVPASHALHFMDSDQLGIVSEILQIRGEGLTVGGASASGGVALLHGQRQVATGRAEACLVIGAAMMLSPLEEQALRNTGAMSPTGVCRPFDVARDGFVYAPGSASVLLEARDARVKRRGRAHGVLRGGAQCLDGNRSADPSAAGEARAMRAAVIEAGVTTAQIDYVNTHGTGSSVGDAVEYQALRDVFGDRLTSVWVNATKAITGHALTAAGVIEAVAVLTQMAEGFLHPTVGLEHPLGSGARFVGPVAVAAPCRLALSNSFGFGGINSALVFERP